MLSRGKQNKYPAHCSPATHSTHDLPADTDSVCLHGYLFDFEEGWGTLLDVHGRVGFETQTKDRQFQIGDIVELHGRVRGGVLLVEQVVPLVKVLKKPWEVSGDWQRFNGGGGERRQRLMIRDAVHKAIRGFFSNIGFIEVETPTLVRASGQEVHLQVFETKPQGGEPLFLTTSPEYHMKRLLGSGFDKIFQICRSYRKGESSQTHNPEFTMLEWYRSYSGYEQIIEDVENLVAHVSRSLLGSTKIEYRGNSIDLEPPWRRLTLREAFALYAGMDLEVCENVDEFRQQAHSCGFASVNRDDSWEDLFFKVLIEKVEPALVGAGPIFLKEYPVRLAALAKIKEDDPGVAERVEAYIAGLELANGFTELNDPLEQRQRFMTERQQRRLAGMPVHPLDGDFLDMLEQGMPPAGGVALGVDRLLMLLTDAASIDEVIAFPFER